MLRNLLWIDCIGAWIAGVIFLALSGWLSWLYVLPDQFLIIIGLTNLFYGTFSFYLARKERRSVKLISALALANLAWGFICLCAAFFVFGIASVFGIVHFIGEGIYVGGLGWLEWTQRNNLAR